MRCVNCTLAKKMILCQLRPLTFFHFKVFRDDWLQVAWSSVFLMRKGTRWKPGREETMEQLHEFLTEYSKMPGHSLTSEYFLELWKIKKGQSRY